jgi:toxin ParE1/3/4
MKLRVARSATADLDEIWLYIAQRENVEAAERFLAFLTDKFYLLLRNPRIGRDRPDLRDGVRSFPAANYRIYYRLEKRGVVRVLFVRHTARDERKLFT